MKNSNKTHKLLFIFPAVGLFQDEGVAGVRKALIDLSKYLTKRGHEIQLLVPTGSESSTLNLIQIPGSLQEFLYNDNKSMYPIFPDSFLGNALYYALQHQKEYDFIINLSNDWLPYYLTPFFETPLMHRMNMSNENEVVSDIIVKTAKAFPKRVGVLCKTQGEDVGLYNESFILTHGINVDIYPFHDGTAATNNIAVIARVSPEKGIEDAAAIAFQTGNKLLIFGYLQNQEYFDNIKNKYPNTVEYRGFLKHEELVAQLATCKSVLCTHKWVDALPAVSLQAMACGIPVISYALGGTIEAVKDGKTGFLIEPNNIELAIKALNNIDTIRRQDCRQHIIENYSIARLGELYEEWFEVINNVR